MGIEPFLLSSTLEILIAQRLVRVICSNCRRTVTTNRKEISEKLPPGFSSKVNALYSGKGCPVCSGTGYLGRTAIFEVIKLTPALRELILKSPSATQIWDLAIKEGSRSMFEDGLEKVGAGVTTLEELLRVAPPQ
jgi:type II secretory ATPase GspE/PulE/Tfp pilus assembly ATPase PilB-like protein